MLIYKVIIKEDKDMLTMVIIRVAVVVVLGIIICGVIYNSIRKDEKMSKVYEAQDYYDEYKAGQERKVYWKKVLDKLGAEPDEAKEV